MKQTVMGVHATSAKPDLRGFVMLGVLIATPVGAVLFGVEVVIGWAFQMQN
ncbi:hypothetical protein [Profundibacter sp.]